MNKNKSIEKNPQGVRNKNISKAYWNDRNTSIFVDICVDAVNRGLRPGTHFNKGGWEWVVERFNGLSNCDFNRAQLKNKWDQLKCSWKNWKDLKGNETGLGWNFERGTIAADVTWWEEKRKINPEAARFQFKGIDPELESKLDVMFMDIVPNGRRAASAANIFDVGMRSTPTLADDDDDNATPFCTPVTQHPDEGSGDSEEDHWVDHMEAMAIGDGDIRSGTHCTEEAHTGGGSRKRSAEKSRSRGKKAKKGKRVPLREHMATLVETMRSRGTPSVTSDMHGWTIKKAVETLMALPGLTKRQKVMGSNLMMDQAKREVFMSLPDEYKSDWVEYNINI